MTAPAPITAAEHLAAQIKRLQALRAENAADHRPSFVAMLTNRVPR